MARSRFRSVRYDLDASIEVARLVESAGGSIGADLLAPSLGYSGTNNGAYLTRVANARLFGVVTGRGSRFETTERGRRILAGGEPDASVARRDAFFAIPLFRAVADAAARRQGALPADLGSWLEAEFGETPSKSQPVADRLIASAGQAGVLRRTVDGNYQLTASLTNFTPVDNPPLPSKFHPLGFLRRSSHSPSREDVTVAENGIWLDEEPEGASKRIPSRRRVGVLAAAAMVLIVVAVPVALVAAGSPSRPTAVHKPAQRPHLGNGPAEHQVLSALSATTDSGSFDFSYTISSTAASASNTTTPTTECSQVKVPVPTGAPNLKSGSATVPVVGESGVTESGSASSSSSVTQGGASVTLHGGSISEPANPGPEVQPNTTLPAGYKWETEKECSGPMVAANPDVQGGGVINTNPLAMVASAKIGSGLDVSVRIDGTDVYEGSSSDTGLAPAASDATVSGSNIPGFAGITESTLGNREGAVAMMGMASPTGYLDLIQPAIDAAAETGTGTVDGTPVTVYQVTNNLDQLAAAPGLTPAESQTITTALALLKSEGYTSNTVIVSIDNDGYIREVKSTDAFSDGGSVTLDATFSNFGCAGTVLMPGQTGSGSPPTDCTSPDSSNSSQKNTPSSPPTTTLSPTTTTPVRSKISTSTSTTAPSTSATTGSSTSTTTIPSSTSTTTTTTVSPTSPTSSVP